MRCPFCNHESTQVLDSRPAADGAQVRRRRQCLNPDCKQRFTTREVAKLKYPNVAKKGKPVESFDRDKLAHSVEMALRNRAVSRDEAEDIVESVCEQARAHSSKTVSSELLGRWVIDALRARDQIACILYASVFEGITTIQEWRELLEREAEALPESARQKQISLLGGKAPVDDAAS